MARSNFSFHKRQKELARKQKKELKRQSRLEKKAQQDEAAETPTESDGDGSPTVEAESKEE